MKKLKTIILSIAFMAISANAMAQFESSIFFRMLMPVGTFAKDVDMVGNTSFGLDNIGKDAIFGIGGTYRIGYVFDIGVGLIQPFAEGSFDWNRISNDNRSKFEDYDGRVPKYFNIPIMLGINYVYPLDETFQPYGEFGVGYDLLFIGSEGEKGSKVTDMRYTAGGALCWQLGAGVIIGKYFSAGLSYIGYGRHKIHYSSKSESLAAQNSEKNVYRTIGSFAIRLGFHF